LRPKHDRYVNGRHGFRGLDSLSKSESNVREWPAACCTNEMESTKPPGVRYSISGRTTIDEIIIQLVNG